MAELEPAISSLVTHCLTIGRRPDLLTQTLQSLHGLPSLPTLAINDFGDAETNEVFQTLCPEGRLVGPGHHIGHHAAVDEMYRHVETPFIFHNEDDWEFSRVDFLDDALTLLETDPKISAVCLRGTGDMWMSTASRRKITTNSIGGVEFRRVDAQHPVWYGYTFNPHLIRRSLWLETHGFSQFINEKALSGYMRKAGLHVAFLLPAACRHIGNDRSNVARKQSRLKSFRNWVRGIKQDL